MSFSIRLSSEEKGLAESYAEKHLNRRFLSELKMNMISLWLPRLMQSTREAGARVGRFPNCGKNWIYEIFR